MTWETSRYSAPGPRPWAATVPRARGSPLTSNSQHLQNTDKHTATSTQVWTQVTPSTPYTPMRARKHPLLTPFGRISALTATLRKPSCLYQPFSSNPYSQKSLFTEGLQRAHSKCNVSNRFEPSTPSRLGSGRGFRRLPVFQAVERHLREGQRLASGLPIHRWPQSSHWLTTILIRMVQCTTSWSLVQSTTLAILDCSTALGVLRHLPPGIPPAPAGRAVTAQRRTPPRRHVIRSEGLGDAGHPMDAAFSLTDRQRTLRGRCWRGRPSPPRGTREERSLLVIGRKNGGRSASSRSLVRLRRFTRSPRTLPKYRVIGENHESSRKAG